MIHDALTFIFELDSICAGSDTPLAFNAAHCNGLYMTRRSRARTRSRESWSG
jgi:hypothetical protein